MRAKELLFFIIFAISIFSSQEQLPTLISDVESSQYELFSDWKFLSVGIILLSILLVSLAYAIGQAFNFDDLKVWAKVELGQVIASALILAVFMVLLISFESLFIVFVNSGGDLVPYHCDADDAKSCSNQVADEYIQKLIDLGHESSTANIENAYEYARAMGRRHGATGHTLLIPPLLWGSFSAGEAPWNILHVERLSLVTEQYGPILASLYAQKFLATDIAYSIGPYILVLGLLTRCFYGTRKLGGLLIAIGIGVMFVFPLMYVFNSLTLAMTVYGGTIEDASGGVMVCPTECTDALPVGYYKKEGGVYPVYSSDLTFEEYSKVSDLKSLSDSVSIHIDDATRNIYTCNPVNVDIYETSTLVYSSVFCPSECKAEPYPIFTDSCIAPEEWECTETNEYPDYENIDLNIEENCIKAACDKIPQVCKRNLILDVDKLKGVYLEQYEKCPEDCKTIPPLKSDCSQECLDIRPECRVLYYDDGEFPATSSYYDEIAEKCDVGDDDCYEKLSDNERDLLLNFSQKAFVPAYCTIEEAISVVGGLSCDIDMPMSSETGQQKIVVTEDNSKETPGYCVSVYNCIEVDSNGNCPEYYAEPETHECFYCTVDESNHVFVETENGCNLPSDIGNPKTAAEQSCIFIVPKETGNCEECLFVNDFLNFNPPVIFDCTMLCGDEMPGPTAISSSDFAKLSSKGMYGTEDIKSISGFILPAYILPLFNILVTIMFIKTFSPLLGGDIEIPGLSKVF